MRAGRSAVIIMLVVGVILLALDQFTKFLVLQQLVPGQPVTIIEGVAALTLVFNPGLAFGFLSALPPGAGWLVALLSIAALCVLIVMATRLLPESGWLVPLALGMIFGGAIGNLIDRWRFSAVVDFIDLSYRGFHWWAFNVADSGITIGVLLLALYLLLKREPRAA